MHINFNLNSYCLRCFLGAAWLFSISPGASFAACAVTSNSHDDIAIQRVKGDAMEVLKTFAYGGAPMEGFIAKLVASSPNMIERMISLGNVANSAQKRALARGLRTVADSCSVSNPDIAWTIVTGVQRSNLPELIKDYDEADMINSVPTPQRFVPSGNGGHVALPVNLGQVSQPHPDWGSNSFALRASSELLSGQTGTGASSELLSSQTGIGASSELLSGQAGISPYEGIR